MFEDKVARMTNDRDYDDRDFEAWEAWEANDRDDDDRDFKAQEKTIPEALSRRIEASLREGKKQPKSLTDYEWVEWRRLSREVNLWRGIWRDKWGVPLQEVDLYLDIFSDWKITPPFFGCPNHRDQIEREARRAEDRTLSEHETWLSEQKAHMFFYWIGRIVVTLVIIIAVVAGILWLSDEGCKQKQNGCSDTSALRPALVFEMNTF